MPTHIATYAATRGTIVPMSKMEHRTAGPVGLTIAVALTVAWPTNGVTQTTMETGIIAVITMTTKLLISHDMVITATMNADLMPGRGIIPANTENVRDRENIVPESPILPTRANPVARATGVIDMTRITIGAINKMGAGTIVVL